MKRKILALEKQSRRLESTPAERARWTKKVNAHAANFLEQLPDLQAFAPLGDKGQPLENHPISEESMPLETALNLLEKHMDGIALRPASGGHLGYIPGGGIYPTALGDYLAAVSNQYAGIFYAGPGAVRIENLLCRWMCRLVGYPETAHGTLTSGGSIANLAAFATGRDAMKIRAKDIEKSVIYLTEQTHHCVQKAIRIGGMWEAKISYVKMDSRFRMDANALERAILADKKAGLRPFMVVGSAGTTDCGAIDPLEKIADLAAEHSLWFHVDAAYGGFFLLVESEKHKFRGIERADSIAIDPHKGLFLAYGTGAILVKNVQQLFETHYYKANYMQDAAAHFDEFSPADLSPELTRHFRGLRMWLPLQLFGLRPFRAALEEKLLLTRYFYKEIKKMGFDVGPPPELSVIIYRFVPPGASLEMANEFNARLIKLVVDDGRVFLSSTSLDGVFWIRLAVLSFRTRLKTIETALAVLKNGVEKLLAEA